MKTEAFDNISRTIETDSLDVQNVSPPEESTPLSGDNALAWEVSSMILEPAGSAFPTLPTEAPSRPLPPIPYAPPRATTAVWGTPNVTWQARSAEQSAGRAHLEWALSRALPYSDTGDMRTAVMSLVSDSSKHPSTQGIDRLMVRMILSEATNSDELRKEVFGFNV